jgi:hypothetical protein
MVGPPSPRLQPLLDDDIVVLGRLSKLFHSIFTGDVAGHSSPYLQGSPSDAKRPQFEYQDISKIKIKDVPDLKPVMSKQPVMSTIEDQEESKVKMNKENKFKLNFDVAEFVPKSKQRLNIVAPTRSAQINESQTPIDSQIRTTIKSKEQEDLLIPGPDKRSETHFETETETETAIETEEEDEWERNTV